MSRTFATDTILLGTGLLSLSGTSLYVNGAPIGGGDVGSEQLTQTGVQLAAKIDLVSGYADETFAPLTTVAASGQAAWNAADNNARNLSGNLTQTGATLFGLINAASAGVSSLNGASGALSLGGAGSVSIITDGQSITISGDTGIYSTFATAANLAVTGSTLDGKVGSLSGYADTTFATQTSLTSTGVTLGGRVDTVTTNLASTGGQLNDKVNSLSGWSASAADLTATGSTLDGRVGTLTTNLTETGISLGAKIDSLSGYSNATFATVAALTDTGVSLGGRIDTVTANLTQTGVQVGTRIDSLSGWAASAASLTSTGVTLGSRIDSVSANLTDTGVALGTKVDLLSGYAASAANLQSTGSNLYTLVANLSGQANTDYATKLALASTGEQAWTATQNNAVNLSGGLTQTGAALNNRINSLSGYADGNFATVLDLATTGATLATNIDNLSGYSDGRFATVANVMATGATLDDRIASLSGYSDATFATIIDLAATGQAAWTAAQNNAVNLSGSLTATGAALIGLISAASAGVSSLNGASGVVTLIGAGTVTVTEDGQTITISGAAGGAGDVTSSQLTSTGVALGGKIDSLSGYSDTTYATVTNLEATGQALFTRDATISGVLNTSIAAASAAANSYADSIGINLSGNLTQTGATLQGRIDTVTANLAGTGSTLDGKINTLSGYGTSTYATLTLLASTGQQALTAANANGTNLSGNLTQTGVALGAKIDSASGWAASAANLQSTGSTLYVLVTNLSGQADTNYATQANLAATGSTLDGRTTSLSGYVNSTFATAASLTTTGVTLGSKIDSLSGYAASITNLQSTGASLYTLVAQTGQAAWIAAQSNATNISGNLTQTGVQLGARIGTLESNLAETSSALNARIASLSGYGDVTYATIANLASTGQLVWTTAQNNAVNLSGNLTQTGVSLRSQLTGVSGFFLTPPQVNLNNGTTLSINTRYYDGFGGDRTLTFDGSPSSSSFVALRANVTGYSVLTVPTSYRLGQLDSTTTLALPPGNHEVSWVYTDGKWWLADSAGTPNNYAAIADPASTDNLLSGYSAGSQWINTSTSGIFQCVRSDTSSATWFRIATGTGGGGGGVGDVTSEQLTATGATLFARDLSISGALVQQISAAAAGVSTINGLSGVISIVGTGQVTITTEGTDTVYISGATANMSPPFPAAVSGEAITLTVDPSKAMQHLRLIATGGNTTLDIAGVYNGANGIVIVDKRFEGEGSLFIPEGSAIINGGGVTGLRLSTGISGYDIFSFVHDGDRFYWASSTLSGAAGGGVGDVTASQLEATGQQAWAAANNNGINLSGSLTATGVTLFQRDLDISGALQAQIEGGGVTLSQLTDASGALTANMSPAFPAAISGESVTLTIDPTKAMQHLKLIATGGDMTLAISNAYNGANGVVVLDKRFEGAATLNIPNGSIIINGGTATGLLMSTGANVYDTFSFFYDETRAYWASSTLSGSAGGGAGDVTSSQLESTGVQLYNHIVGLSGEFNSRPFTKGGSFYNPDGLSSGIHRTPIWRAPFSCTATAVRGFALNANGGVVSATINAYRNNSLALMASDLNVTPTGEWVSQTSLQNAAFSVGDALTLQITNAVNAPASVAIQVDFVR